MGGCQKIMPEAVLRFPEGRYEGEVGGNKVPNGQGCLEFPGNDDLERQIYEGDFKDKKAHGKGLMRWRQGDKYEGEFQNGLKSCSRPSTCPPCMLPSKLSSPSMPLV